LSTFPNVEVIQASFEDWEPGDRRFNALVAANCWHWVAPAVCWRKAHDVLDQEGWLVIMSHIVVREPGEPEVYAETADLHEAYAPGYEALSPLGAPWPGGVGERAVSQGPDARIELTDSRKALALALIPCTLPQPGSELDRQVWVQERPFAERAR
jgi:hypothetical protein